MGKLRHELRRKVFRFLASIYKQRKLARLLMAPDHLLRVARETMEAVKYCFVITSSGSGEVNARVLQPFKPEKDFTVWLGTSASSRKVHEIAQHGHVTLTYIHPRQGGYVTLVGSASLDGDPHRRRRYWREEWIAFFPGGPQSDDYVLICFVPVRIELMSFARSVTPEPFGLRPAILVRSGDSWVVEGGD